MTDYSEHMHDYVPGKWFPELKGVPGKGWRLIETRPLPPQNELVAAAHAMAFRTNYDLCEGQIRSSQRWGTCFQFLDKTLVDSIRRIPNTKYLVALYRGGDFLDGQPVAIALEPQITHALYPDHPHLNLAHNVKIDGKEFFLPTSFCYTNNPAGLGLTEVERVNNAAEIVCEWLFRHQVWLSTRELNMTGTWLGPADPPPEPYPHHILNPIGRCRCGKLQMYKDCHMADDMSSRYSKLWARRIIEKSDIQQKWEQRQSLESQSINTLKTAMGL